MNERGHYGQRDISRIGQAPSTQASRTAKTLGEQWTEIYQILASQVGELVRDPSTPSGYRVMTQQEFAANPPDPNKVAWWKAYASPLIQEWVRFMRDWAGKDRTFASEYI